LLDALVLALNVGQLILELLHFCFMVDSEAWLRALHYAIEPFDLPLGLAQILLQPDVVGAVFVPIPQLLLSFMEFVLELGDLVSHFLVFLGELLDIGDVLDVLLGAQLLP
jgi:hypothetical protein